MNAFFETLLITDWFWRIPAVLLGTAFLFCGILYFLKNKRESGFFVKNLKQLVWALILGRLIYTAILTFFQYFVWSQTEVSRVFLTSPADATTFPGLTLFAPLFNGKFGYFALYCIGRYWLGTLLSIFIAYVFYIFLRFLKKYKERFFEEGELELGLVIGLIVGWPKFVIFVPLVFIFVIFISIFRMLFAKEKFTTFGLPFLAAAIPALIWGIKLIDLLGLGAIKA
ncbi:MAG: hypothetical protein Q7S36_01270 [Candidatus Liptonbacteria bacterium]|nr:hypothetical protein [Candidatus Liptonbacteria bacterium]